MPYDFRGSEKLGEEKMSSQTLVPFLTKGIQNYAVVIASFSAITSLVYVLPYVRRWVLWPWDFLLWQVWDISVLDNLFSLSPSYSFLANHLLSFTHSVFWIAVLGIFARLYIDDYPSGGGSSKKVKSATFVDLTNMILWFVTGLCGAAVFVRSRYGGGEDVG